MTVKRVSKGLYEVRVSVTRRVHGTRKEAEAFDREMRRRMSIEHGLWSATVMDLLPARRAWHEAQGHSHDTITKCEKALRRLCTDLADGDIALDDITIDALEQWQAARRKQVKACTVNRELGQLMSLARWAIRTQRWLPESNVPWLHLPRLRNASVRRTIPSLAEMARALHAVPEHVRLPLVCFAFLADRPGAVCELRRRDIHEPEHCTGWGRIELQHRKGGDPRTVVKGQSSPVWPVLHQAYQLFGNIKGREIRGYDRVFCNLRGAPWTTQTLNQAWQRYLRRAGLPPMNQYTIRHLVGTLGAQLGISEIELQSLLGHRTRDMSRFYVHGVAGQQARDAGQLVDEAMAQQLLRALEIGHK